VDGIIEFDFEIKNIKGRENRVADALGWSVQIVHLASIRMCEYDIEKGIRTLLQGDDNFNMVKERLQQELERENYEEY